MRVYSIQSLSRSLSARSVRRSDLRPLACYADRNIGKSTAGFSSSASNAVIVPPVLQAPESLPSLNKGALVNWYDNRFNFQAGQQRKQLSEQFFQAAMHQANDPNWFGPGRIPRDFRNKHALLTMHLWFLNKRLISDTADPERALQIQEELFNIFWDDTAIRVRRAGINELLVSKNVTKVQQYTWIHLTHYDHIYTEFLEQPQERFQELKSLIARHILIQEGDKSDDPDLASQKNRDQMDRLAWYIDAQYQNVCLDWPDSDYREGRIQWIDLPDFEGMKDNAGKTLPHSPIDPTDLLPSPWLRNFTLKGEEYYWNPETDESSWERPGAAEAATS